MNPFSQMIVRAAFCCGLLLLLASTLLPTQIEVPAIIDDKLQHFVSFFLLSSIGMTAWDKERVRIGIVMVLVGAAIETFQALPLIGRDPEILDWIADTAGVVLAAIVVDAYRRLAGNPSH